MDYPPYLLPRAKTLESPVPFGPNCLSTERCYGSLVKYLALLA